MNILHLEASSGWGGQEIRILRESIGMRERGHSVVIAVMSGGKLKEKAQAEGFKVYEVNFRKPFWPICLLLLLIVIRRHKIDLVNTHSSLDSWIGGIAARLAKRKVVRTRHLSTPIKKGFNSRFLYGKLADFVVTTCASIIPMISKQSGKKLKDCCSIATGVNPEEISVEDSEIKIFRKKLGLRKNDFLVGTACMMRSWKGIDDLLMAADLLRGIPNLKWVIIGGGHADRHLKRAKELKINSIVMFTGHLDHPFPAIKALDIFTLFSTAHEGVSQAILQAAYLERPLIATPTGGLKEVCLDGKTGLIVPPASPKKIADAVVTILDNTQLRTVFGQEAKKVVLEKFTMQHTLDEMERVYREVSGNGACRQRKESIESIPSTEGRK